MDDKIPQLKEGEIGLVLKQGNRIIQLAAKSKLHAQMLQFTIAALSEENAFLMMPKEHDFVRVADLIPLRKKFDFLHYQAETEYNPITGKFTVIHNGLYIDSINEDNIDDAMMKFINHVGYSLAKAPINYRKTKI